MVSVQDVIEGARVADLADLPIFLHSSLSSFGCVENGADTIIDGLLQSGCTVVVPRNPRPFDWLILTREISPILASLTTSAAAIAAISNN